MIRTWTLDGLAGALREGKTTSRELVEQALAKISDPAGEGVRAFIKVDADGARATADYQDHLRRRNRQPSPFAGIPVSVKDLFDLAGEVTTAGSRVLKDAAPALADAPAIAALKSAGMIVLGRTNMTEFAYSGVGLNPHYGTPKSVFDRKTGRIPGGSSSGAGVAVADGMCALGIGTDTSGSCRIPAAYNGIVGYKPSRGRVSTRGAYPLSARFDSIGPLGNSVACCAAADALMAGDWPGKIVAREISSLRIGILKTAVLEGLDSNVAAAYERALARLSKAGATLVDFEFEPLLEVPGLTIKGGIVAAEAHAHHRDLMGQKGAEYDPRVRTRIEAAGGISAADYLAIVKRREAMIGRFNAAIHGFSAVALPTVMIIPPPISALGTDQEYFRYNSMSLRNTYVGSFLNCCALSLPVNEPGAAPVGLMLMGVWGQDQGLFSIGKAIETLLQSG
ncbi:MAG TPA: amidase [Aestuariivirga sp.]|nr:amidase [Aestuariivirga sp.]